MLKPFILLMTFALFVTCVVSWVLRPARVAPPETTDASASEDVPTPPKKQELSTAVYSVLERLITGKVGEGDRQRLNEELLDVLRREGLEIAKPQRNAIEATVGEMLRGIEDYKPDGPATEKLTGRARRETQKLARDYATLIRIRLDTNEEAAPEKHEGRKMSSPRVEDIAVREGYEALSWRTVGDFVYDEGMTLPPPVEAARGRKVAMTGYMLAGTQFENIREFLLVESRWSCCFGRPPGVNEVVVVRIPESRAGADLVSQPVIVHGRFGAEEERDDEFVTSVYQITADSVSRVE